MRAFLVVSMLLTIAACGGSEAPPSDAGLDAGDGGDAGLGCEPPAALPATCNGLESLCAARYDEVAYPTTHNAFSSQADGFTLPNQTHAIATQLEDGVRALMLDTYEDDGEVVLCHGYCALGSRPLVDALVDVREFLRCHPAEVVTLIFESYVTAEQTAAAFEASGASAYVHAQPLAAAWPTLGEMIAADTRLVVFTDAGGGTDGWYHDVWQYARETPFAAASPDELACAGGRGPEGAGLLIFNHFLTEVSGRPDLAEMVNHDPFLHERIVECEAELGQDVNFVTVDFYEIGDVFAAVAAENVPL